MSLVWWILALVAFLWSLLTIFCAPTFFLFLFAVAATEFGYFGAIGCLALAVIASLNAQPAAWLFVLAGFLYCTPGLRAFFYAHRHGLNFRLALRLPRSAVKRVPLTTAKGLRVECFFTEAKKPRPLVIVVHGGSWHQGNHLEAAGFMRLLARIDCVVASVEYGLAPLGKWPSQRDDVLAGYEAVLARAEEFGIDPARVYLLGRSAGGQIASAFACWEKAPPLHGCICFYTPFDMFFAYEHGREDDILRSPQLLRQYLNGKPDEAAENYTSASAYCLLSEKAPPFLVLHGTRDELVWIWQSRRFAERAKEVGARCQFLELPWATHGFDFNPHGPGTRVAVAAIRDFIFEMGLLH